MSLSLYTFGNMRKAVIDSITSEAAGFPKENMIDFNRDTYWKPTSTASQTWDIDLQSSKYVNSACFLVQNYSTDFSAVKLVVQYSDDDSSYSDITGEGGDSWAGSTGHQIYCHDFGGYAIKRYWRITLNSLPSTIQLAGCFLSYKSTISMNHQLPNRNTTRYFSSVEYSPSGRAIAMLHNSRSVKILPRTYMLGSTDFGTLQTAFANSYGTAMPLIIYDGTNYYYVRFQDDQLDQNEFADTFYNPSVTFIEEPYIPDGEAY